MRHVERSEVLPIGEYEAVRDRFRRRIIELKRRRRVALGDRMSVVFENRDTVLLQIQEMLRTERITNESSVMHEIATYNELVPGTDQLSMTLFIEEPDKPSRERLLRDLEWMESRVFLDIDGRRCAASFGVKHGAEPGRTTAVQYYLVDLPADVAARLAGKRAERVAVVVDHEAYPVESQLGPDTIAELAADLAEP